MFQFRSRSVLILMAIFACSVVFMLQRSSTIVGTTLLKVSSNGMQTSGGYRWTILSDTSGPRVALVDSLTSVGKQEWFRIAGSAQHGIRLRVDRIKVPLVADRSSIIVMYIGKSEAAISVLRFNAADVSQFFDASGELMNVDGFCEFVAAHANHEQLKYMGARKRRDNPTEVQNVVGELSSSETDHRLLFALDKEASLLPFAPVLGGEGVGG